MGLDATQRLTRQRGWIRGWSEKHIKSVWDQKIREKAWLLDPAYKVITDACHDGISSVLDIGCGGGIQYAAFQEFEPQIGYNGVDIHPGMVDYCKGAWRGIAVEVADATSLPYEQDQFDCAVLRQVIEHYKPQVAFEIIEEAARVAQYQLIILFRVVPVQMTEDVHLGRRGSFDYNRYAYHWLTNTIRSIVDRNTLSVTVEHIKKPPQSTAKGDQEIWIARY